MKLLIILTSLLCLGINTANAIEYEAKIIRVVDGDTVVVLHNTVKKKSD